MWVGPAVLFLMASLPQSVAGTVTVVVSHAATHSQPASQPATARGSMVLLRTGGRDAWTTKARGFPFFSCSHVNCILDAATVRRLLQLIVTWRHVDTHVLNDRIWGFVWGHWRRDPYYTFFYITYLPKSPFFANLVKLLPCFDLKSKSSTVLAEQIQYIIMYKRISYGTGIIIARFI